jgi:hypothetical protein
LEKRFAGNEFTSEMLENKDLPKAVPSDTKDAHQTYAEMIREDIRHETEGGEINQNEKRVRLD